MLNLVLAQSAVRLSPGSPRRGRTYRMSLLLESRFQEDGDLVPRSQQFCTGLILGSYWGSQTKPTLDVLQMGTVI